MSAWPEPIPVSALEHWSYCPRQCGLIHLEGTFRDNLLTVRGHHAHERVHDEGSTSVDGARVLRSIPIWSDELGLIGKADAVELRGDVVYPIEYKVGRPGTHRHAELQLAAQAMCLEEMLGTPVPEGAVFYRATQHRRAIAIDADLRDAVRRAIVEIRFMLGGVALPPAVDDARCPQCSLIDVCMPRVVSQARRLTLLHGELFKPDGWIGAAARGGD